MTLITNMAVLPEYSFSRSVTIERIIDFINLHLIEMKVIMQGRYVDQEYDGFSLGIDIESVLLGSGIDIDRLSISSAYHAIAQRVIY